MAKKTIELRVTSLASSGEGVGHLEDKVVFIPLTAPGDLIRAHIVQNKKNYIRAQLVEVLEAGPDRTEPPCVYYGDCGGCNLQHLNLKAQHHWKVHNLKANLSKIAKISDFHFLKDMVPSPKSLNYRNRIRVQVSPKGVSFSAKGSHRPVPIQTCLIAEENINQEIASLNRENHSKSFRLELATQDSQVHRHKLLNPGHSELGFRQVNTPLNNVLLEKTLEAITRIGAQQVLDLYCGQGNWINYLSKKKPGLQGVGVDNNPINIEKARSLGPKNVDFFCLDALEFLKSQKPDCDVLILDPPRRGCDSQLFQVLEQSLAHPQHIIYMSCHPATMARDLKELFKSGYDLEEMIPIDMFPQTHHLEVWSILRSNSQERTHQ